MWFRPPVGGQEFPGPVRDFEAVQELGLHDPDKRTHQESSDTLRLMLWGIDRPEWLVLWSGVLGAVISASVAATIAVLVLQRSNRHQQLLVEQQQAMQRAEAALSRERLATADIMSAVGGFRTAAEASLDAIQEQGLAFHAAAFRWHIEVDGVDLVTALLPWSNVMSNAANRQYVAKTKGDRETAKAWSDLLLEATARMLSFALVWHREPDTREVELKRLAENKNRMEAAMETLSSTMRSRRSDTLK